MTDTAAPPTRERWTAQWKELKAEVIDTGLCTGCSGCVVTCPHDVIGYEHEEGKYLPFHLEEELGLDNCIHGEKGCTTCTRACPRFRAWETSADMHLFGRVREPDEMAGVWRQLYLTRASDEMVHKMGQDGGLVSAMLIWLRDNDYIDAALVSGVEDDDAWKAKPQVVSTRDEILATAGSRYTYCANPLALPEAKEKGFDRLAQFDPRSARVVECRFFAGLPVAETAVALGVSEATVKRDWRTARAILRDALGPLRAGA